MKKDLLKQFNLPSYLNSDSFAGDAQLIEKKFKDRTGIAEQRTKEALLARIAKAQEYTKMQEGLAANASQVPDMMEGQIPEGMEEFAYGGMTNQYSGEVLPTGVMDEEQGMDVADMDFAGTAGNLLQAGQNIFGDTGVDTTGRQTYDVKGAKQERTMGAVTGGANLAKGIATMNPMGIISGGAQLAGSIFGGKKINEMDTANQKAYIGSAYGAGRQSDFAYGGKMTNKYAGDDPTKPSWMDQDASAYNGSMATDLSAFAGYKAPGDFSSSVNMTGAGSNQYSTPSDAPKTGAGKAVDWLGKNAGELARFAPIVGNLTDKMERPTTAQATKVQGRYAEKPLDLNYMTNQIKQSRDEVGMASELSGGDLAGARNMARALNIDEQRAVGDAAFKGQVGERDESRFKAQFDNANDKFNAMQDERYIDRAARDKGAFETAKANNRTAIFEDLGKIGKEYSDKKTIEKMLGYKWNGEYFVDKKGKKVEDKTVLDAVKQTKTGKADTNQTMFGGYLKTK